MSMAWEPGRRSSFFSEPVTCITEISLIVALFSQKWTYTPNWQLWQKLDLNISNLLKMLKVKSLPFTSKKINSGKTCQLKKKEQVTSLYIFLLQVHVPTLYQIKTGIEWYVFVLILLEIIWRRTPRLYSQIVLDDVTIENILLRHVQRYVCIIYVFFPEF